MALQGLIEQVPVLYEPLSSKRLDEFLVVGFHRLKKGIMGFTGKLKQHEKLGCTCFRHSAAEDHSSRRNFLMSLAAMVAASTVEPAGLLLNANTTIGSTLPSPDVAFPTDPRKRLAIGTWSFRSVLRGPQSDAQQSPMGLPDLPEVIFDKLGICNIEPWNRHFESLDPGYLAQIREATRKVGGCVANIAVDGKESYYDNDPAVRAKAVAFGKQWVDVAVAVAAPGIRTKIAQPKNHDPDVALAATSLREVVDYGMSKGIVISVENDNLISEEPFFLVKLIETINSPYLRALPDFCNSARVGAEFNDRAMRAMFPHAYSICHVKAYEVESSGHIAHVNLGKTFAILRAAGFKGYCSLEWEGKGSPFDGTRQLMKESLRYLA
jgi:sugar phosphate isomerase/epimerase